MCFQTHARDSGDIESDEWLEVSMTKLQAEDMLQNFVPAVQHGSKHFDTRTHSQLNTCACTREVVEKKAITS
jgi:hypothetical protein